MLLLRGRLLIASIKTHRSKEKAMKFAAGVLLGLLLSGPSSTHYHPVDRHTYVINVTPVRPQVESNIDIDYVEVDGQEDCVVKLLGGPAAMFTAQDVIDLLDEAWSQWYGPCDMLERRKG
jgi:hypothetical protein